MTLQMSTCKLDGKRYSKGHYSSHVAMWHKANDKLKTRREKAHYHAAMKKPI
jgi:hypothetical protein